MDLFEDYENLPSEIQDIIETITEQQLDYKDCADYVKKFNQLGYHCEYDLSGELYNLKKLKGNAKVQNTCLFRKYCAALVTGDYGLEIDSKGAYIVDEENFDAQAHPYTDIIHTIIQLTQPDIKAVMMSVNKFLTDYS